MLQKGFILSVNTVCLTLGLIFPALAQKPKTEAEKIEYQGLKAVASADELKEFRKLTGQKKADWLRIFWAKRDPTPTTPENEFKAEHEKRVQYVYENFRTEQYGYIWDDRGEVYLRYGDPDERNLSVERAFDRKQRFFSAYNIRDVFNDPVKLRLLIARNLAAQFAGFGDPQGTTVEQAKAAEEIDKPVGPYGGGSTAGDIKFDLEAISRASDHIVGEVWRYYRFGLTFQFQEEIAGFFELVPYVDYFGIGQNYQQFITQTSIATEIQKEIYEHDYGGKSMDFALAVTRFRGDSKENYLVNVNLGIPGWQLGIAPADSEKVSFMRRIVLYDQQYQSIVRESTSFTQPVNRGELKNWLFVEQKRFVLNPGQYYLAVEVRDLVTQKVGIYKKELTLPQYSSPVVPEISDLELASFVRRAQISDRRYVHKDLVVMPQPSSVFFPSQVMYYYYEIYNLKPDSEGKVRFSVTTQVFNYRTHKLQAEYQPRDYQADTTDIYQTGKLNLNDLNPGEYVLSLRIKDSLTGKEKTALAGFKITKED